MRKNLFFILLLGMAFSAAAGVETETVYLSGRGTDSAVNWDFMITGGRRANEWAKIPVPSNWELQGFGEYNYGHDKNKADEKGVYKTNFDLPAAWAGKRVFLVFDGAMTDTDVKINGKSAGPVHQGGFYRFEYDVTNLVAPGTNLLEATVSKMSANKSINFAERKSDFWVFGGIFRPVFLKAVPMEFIDWTAVDARADGEFSLNVHLGSIKKANRVQAQIYDLSGRPFGDSFAMAIGSDKVITLQTGVSDQKNWTAETPFLYTVEVTLMQDDKPIHSVRERFGFRSFEVRDGEGLFLNGSPIVLKGCDRHSFWPSTGRALNRRQCREDILTMKEMNMNAVRMSHYPPDAFFLDLCDELGMYVLDELTGWQKPPYDTPTGERLVWEMVKRDVNHPCILFWDNGNEGGWNTDLDDEFGKWDPQNRRVLHPWELHGGVDTDHYESYASTAKKMTAANIFMPTEYLHGLYDGGLGAGLEDYWNLMWGNPLTGGMFLWVFADEGVVRTDRNGLIDTDGNHAPDGILGPYHQREASFYTIKEIWSPVYIDSNRELPADFDGEIPVENRYDYTNLKQCRFQWRLGRFYAPAAANPGSRTLCSGEFNGPDIPARAKGALKLDLPENWRQADLLALTAIDKNDQPLFTWKWRISSPQKVMDRFVRRDGGAPLFDAKTLTATAGSFQFHFDQNTGELLRVENGRKTIPFGNGPRFVCSDVESHTGKAKFHVSEKTHSLVLDVQNHPDFDVLRWTVYGSGWLQLDYSYDHTGAVDFMGASFDFPEDQMNEVKWLGKGPYRVWKNRLKGGTVDVWRSDYRNFKVNTAWDYPVSAGYFADFNWLVLYTTDGPLTIATDNDDLFMRLFAQENGDDPRYTKMIWPAGDISFLHAIPAIGTKFKPAEAYGPMSQKFQADGTYSGRLYFYFGLPEEGEKLNLN